MPKKTREEKMAATLRRLKEQVAGQQIPTTQAVENAPTVLESTPPPQRPPTQVGYNLRDFKAKSASTAQPIRLEEEHYNYAYVAADLRKIVLLAVAAVALEIILNLTTRASFAKLILRTFGLEI